MARGILDILRRSLADLPSRVGLGPAIRTAQHLPLPLPREREVLRAPTELAERLDVPLPGAPPTEEALLIEREPPAEQEQLPVIQGRTTDVGPSLELPPFEERLTTPGAEDEERQEHLRAADELTAAWRDARRSIGGRGLRLFSTPLPPELEEGDEFADLIGLQRLNQLNERGDRVEFDSFDSAFAIRIPTHWGLGSAASVGRMLAEPDQIADPDRVSQFVLVAEEKPVALAYLSFARLGTGTEESQRSVAEGNLLLPVDMLPNQPVITDIYVLGSLRDTPALMALIGAFRQEHGSPIFAMGPFSPRVARLLHSLERTGKARLIDSNYEEMFGEDDLPVDMMRRLPGAARDDSATPQPAEVRAVFAAGDVRVDDVTDVTWVPTSDLVREPAYGVFGVRVHARPEANTRSLWPLSQMLSAVYNWEPQGIKRVGEDTYFFTFTITKPTAKAVALFGGLADENDDEYERMTKAYAILRDSVRPRKENDRAQE